MRPHVAEALPGLEFEHDAPSLRRKKVAHVLRPPGPLPAEGARVCYMLHPFGGDRHSWARWVKDFPETLTRDVLFVFPESGRRWMLNDAAGNRYEDYFVRELLPSVEAAFLKGRPARERLIGGFSMGGAGAVHLALRHPGMFSRAFAIAGAFYASERQGDPYAAQRGGVCMMPTEAEHDRVWGPVGSEVRREYDTGALLQRAAASGRMPALALEVGTEDYPRVVEQNRRLHRQLGEAGVAHLYSEHPGDHGWDYASRAARRLLAQVLLAPPG